MFESFAERIRIKLINELRGVLTKIGTDVRTLFSKIGDTSGLKTTSKSSLVDAINEIHDRPTVQIGAGELSENTSPLGIGWVKVTREELALMNGIQKDAKGTYPLLNQQQYDVKYGKEYPFKPIPQVIVETARGNYIPYSTVFYNDKFLVSINYALALENIYYKLIHNDIVPNSSDSGVSSAQASEKNYAEVFMQDLNKHSQANMEEYGVM